MCDLSKNIVKQIFQDRKQKNGRKSVKQVKLALEICK